jgi:acetolactate synthase-1/2/3 large subunit
VSLPEDVLTDTASVSGRPPIGKIAVHAPAKNQIQDLQTLLESAKKPLVILGGGGWTEHAVQSFQKFAENNALPVACAFRRQDLIDNTSASYAGDLGYGADPALVKRLSEADLIFAVGDRLGEVTSREYTVWTIPQMQAKLIHVYPDRKELGRVYKPDLAIAAEMNVFADAVKDVKCKVSWQDWTKSLRADYEKTLTPTPVSGPLDFAQIMKYLNDVLPKNSIMTNDAGNFSGWLHRYYQWRQYPTQAAPCNGAMGYAVPSAVAAAIAFPDRMVLGFAGDGGFLMTASEIATAIQYKAKPILIVVNNNMYGTIRMHQEKNYPGRISGTELTNPDFAALARSYGAFGATVKKTEEFIPAFIEAQKAGKCAVIEIQLDAEIISTRTTLSAVRKAAMDTKK